MKKYILNKHIRYRKEDGYILICDCKRLLDYEMPLKYLEVLNFFKKGYQPQRKEEREVAEDLLKIGIIEEVGKEIEAPYEDIFNKLGYDENEFF